MRISVALTLLLLSSSVFRADSMSALMTSAVQDAGPVVALLNVNVIPMDRERVLTDRTVIVRGERIAAIGPAGRTPVPDGATRVEARGQYLIPGLGEMHAHLTGANEALNRRILLLNIRHGVTTIRGMLGHPSHLTLRAQVAKGEVPGPTIYTSGPSFNGNTVPTPEAAAKMVQDQKAAGYDFLKIHPGVSRASFDALAATADKVGIRFAGHVPAEVGLTRALEARYATIDHLDGYVEALADEKLAAGQTGGKPTGFFGFLRTDTIDERRIPALVQATKNANVWMVPTETVLHTFFEDTPAAEVAKRPEMQLVPPQMVKGWVGQKEKFVADQGLGTAEARAKFFATRAKLIKALHAGGVKILLGADSPQVFAVPGYATQQELGWLVKAGLTPYQALEAGTRNVAEFFGTTKDRGTLAAAKVADAVLVEGNPLSDIANASKITGVLLRGRWLPLAELDKMVAEAPMP